ncbi:MAG: lipoprotein-releasing ABC transporter permease subunit [Legionella sp.]|nr:lipoprotein-releasing ABC transporter permease subunit [Legionella sp.]
MFKPLALFIGLRYVRSKKSNHFISFISLSSMIGIALGVTVLITVLSVMNGFDQEIRKRFFDMAPEITITGQHDKISDWPLIEKMLQNYPTVQGVAPFIGAQGLMTHEGQVFPVLLTGIDPDKEKAVSQLDKKMRVGNVAGLDQFGILLGRSLADKLGVWVGDKVSIMLPQASVTPAGILPRFKRFTVAGIFSAGAGFNFDSQLAFIHLNNAQKLVQYRDEITGFKVKINDIYQAPNVSAALTEKLGPSYMVSNWTQQMGAFFQAIKLEKTMMFLILLLIIAVAAFNLISSLVMVVNDKQAEIAILRTIGATPRMILAIFIAQGTLVGVIGVLFGLIGGVLLASNATSLVNHLQSLLDINILSANVYFVDYLPSKIDWNDVWQVAVIALLMSFLATLYPAWRASRIQIAEALHYE